MLHRDGPDDVGSVSNCVQDEAVWQRCYVHFLCNALGYLPRKADDHSRQELRWLYDRRNLKEAQQDPQAWLTLGPCTHGQLGPDGRIRDWLIESVRAGR